jgi:hypothetical protein
VVGSVVGVVGVLRLNPNVFGVVGVSQRGYDFGRLAFGFKHFEFGLP